MENDAHVKAVYTHLKSWIDGSQELDASSMVMLVTQVIGLIQREIPEHGQGDYKKQIALTVIRLVIKDSELTDVAKANLTLLVDTTVPTMIDAMISIAKNKIDLGKATNAVAGCFGKCL